MRIPNKNHWPQAFAESKALADELLRINREKKEYRKVEPGSIPSDRELFMAAGVNIFWEYKLSQEASHAARILTWAKIEAYLERAIPARERPGGASDFEGRKLLKAIRRLKNQEADSAFLIMWGVMEGFLAQASNPAFWLKYEQPQHAILELRQTLVGMAQGEESGKERSESNPSETNGTRGGENSSEGDSREAHAPAVPGAGSESGIDRQGADEARGGVQEGGGRVEAAQSAAQNGGEKPE